MSGQSLHVYRQHLPSQRLQAMFTYNVYLQWLWCCLGCCSAQGVKRLPPPTGLPPGSSVRSPLPGWRYPQTPALAGAAAWG